MTLNFKEKYILENDFVLMQPLELSDFDVLLQYSEERTRYLGIQFWWCNRNRIEVIRLSIIKMNGSKV